MTARLPYATTQLPGITTLDTFDAIHGESSGDHPDLDSPLAQVRMFFVRHGSDQPALKLTTMNGAITITDPARHEFRVNSIPAFPLGPGSYAWSIEQTTIAGSTKTRMAGTLTVLSDPTRP